LYQASTRTTDCSGQSNPLSSLIKKSFAVASPITHLLVYAIGVQLVHGIRKVRRAIKSKGKSGGVRVIYFYATAAAQIRLIAIYKKGIKDDLNAAKKKVLKKLNENWQEAGWTKKLFVDLVGSMQQHNEIIAGTRKPARVTKVDAQSIKVLRAKAGLTQDKFAALIQVDLSTLRNWEQGRREPTGPAKALIRAITNDPKHVLKALEVGESMRKAG